MEIFFYSIENGVEVFDQKQVEKGFEMERGKIHQTE